MANTRDIQRRIKSVASTRKITKAMEMVSAAKMRRAVDSVLRTRTYANLSWETVLNLAESLERKGEQLHPLLSRREEVKKVGIILISSNRGLCGGFNTAIINKVQESIAKHQKMGEETVIEAEFVLMGKKGAKVHHYHGHNITAEFPKFDLASEVKEIVPVAQLVIKEFLNKKYDKIMVAYTDFVNASKQVPRIKQILPIDLSAREDHLGVVGKNSRVGVGQDLMEEKKEKHLSDEKFSYEYAFEPDAYGLLDEMLPRLIEVQLYQALLESNASEHSARMAAMHQATEAANDMVSELTLYYNKARQAAITREISEISAGANALGE